MTPPPLQGRGNVVFVLFQNTNTFGGSNCIWSP